MRVLSVRLQNFRNYVSGSVELAPARNVIIGQNAQGKSNLLEAIELVSTGKSNRASSDRELVRWNEINASIEVAFESNGSEENLAIAWGQKSDGKAKKDVKVNGILQPSTRSLLGRLVTVSFSTVDLDLLRGTPKFRREWLDDISVRLRPAFHDTLTNFNRTVQQRNKLLKSLAEKGKVTVSDQDELVVWDTQMARFGAQIIKTRMYVLDQLLPQAQIHQSHLSRQEESLSAGYLFRSKRHSEDDDGDGEEASPMVSIDELRDMDEPAVAKLMSRLMKERRGEEIRRKVSLIGPHRDDIEFTLNRASATTFASQGQQRSLVLSLKLAELKLIADRIREKPVFLLDDVLAELDSCRQALLMSAVTDDMQTIITTTGLSVFQTDWLSSARVLEVERGAVAALTPAAS